MWSNKPAAANPAIASELQGRRHWRGVAEPERSLRRDVASTTAERGLVLTQPCLSRQVFYGSRRLAGGASYCQGSGASQTMQSTWEPQSGATLESDVLQKRGYAFPLNCLPSVMDWR